MRRNVLRIGDLRRSLRNGEDLTLEVEGKDAVVARHYLTGRQIEMILAGGLVNWRRERLVDASS